MKKGYRRTNQRWGTAEFDRLLRAVRLEDVTPPAERFQALAASLERSPQSIRAKWLAVRDAALRGQPASSPAVADYLRLRFPQVNARAETLDEAIAAYREARRQADTLLEQVFALAGRDAEALAGLRATLFAVEPAAPKAAHPRPGEEAAAARPAA